MAIYRACLKTGIVITSLWIAYIIVGTAAVLRGWDGRTLPVQLQIHYSLAGKECIQPADLCVKALSSR